MTVELSAAAIADANQAFNSYEDQSEGLGHAFTAELRRMLRLLGDYPERGQVVLGETRQEVLQRFPFSLYYRLRSGSVMGVTVFHASRNLRIWQSRSDAYPGLPLACGPRVGPYFESRKASSCRTAPRVGATASEGQVVGRHAGYAARRRQFTKSRGP